MATPDAEALAQELELMQAMWSEDELRIEQLVEPSSEIQEAVRLVALLTPLTAGDEHLQFLRCELIIQVDSSYPSAPPSLTLGSSRGLTDTVRFSILTALERQAADLSGEPMLLSILETGRELLTSFNVPSGECSICLGMLEGEGNGDAPVPVLRTPCYHVFHVSCMLDYWQSEFAQQKSSTKRSIDVKSADVLCPECRTEIPWDSCPELHAQLESFNHSQLLVPQTLECDDDPLPHLEPVNDSPNPTVAYKLSQEAWKKSEKHSDESSGAKRDRKLGMQPEAFIRLHHLRQGNDEKEKPLLRLLRELGLNAIVYYGKPALMHIQGEQNDVDAFAGTAKRRHITVTIDVVQRSSGPAIPSGLTSIPAKKGSMDGVALRDNLEIRGLGETSFSIVGG